MGIQLVVETVSLGLPCSAARRRCREKWVLSRIPVSDWFLIGQLQAVCKVNRMRTKWLVVGGDIPISAFVFPSFACLISRNTVFAFSARVVRSGKQTGSSQGFCQTCKTEPDLFQLSLNCQDFL